MHPRSFIYLGMDEKNERAIWAMLLKVCEEHKAQYFYMAPKFPYSLPFNRHVSAYVNIRLTEGTNFLGNNDGVQ